MGYTHYWQRNGSKLNAARFAEFSQVARRVVDSVVGQGIPLGDAMGKGKPKINDKSIAFNGVGEQSHESFVINPDQSDFEFCKTNCKPYDVAVVAVLILYKYFFPEIIFSSDGDLNDLRAGASLAREALGKDLEVFESGEGFAVRGVVEVIDDDSASKSFGGKELELLKYAISFLSTNIENASDELDIEIDEEAVKALEDKLYS